MNKKHLDGIYRRRYETYITPGMVYDSRTINPQDIPWDKLTGLEAEVQYKHHIVEPGEGFKCFIRWRFGGYDVDKQEKINVWCIGWTDGVRCFMKEIQFKDGSMKETEYPLDRFKNHLREYERLVS